MITTESCIRITQDFLDFRVRNYFPDLYLDRIFNYRNFQANCTKFWACHIQNLTSWINATLDHFCGKA